MSLRMNLNLDCFLWLSSNTRKTTDLPISHSYTLCLILHTADRWRETNKEQLKIVQRKTCQVYLWYFIDSLFEYNYNMPHLCHNVRPIHSPMAKHKRKRKHPMWLYTNTIEVKKIMWYLTTITFLTSKGIEETQEIAHLTEFDWSEKNGDYQGWGIAHFIYYITLSLVVMWLGIVTAICGFYIDQICWAL